MYIYIYIYVQRAHTRVLYFNVKNEQRKREFLADETFTSRHLFLLRRMLFLHICHATINLPIIQPHVLPLPPYRYYPDRFKVLVMHVPSSANNELIRIPYASLYPKHPSTLRLLDVASTRFSTSTRVEEFPPRNLEETFFTERNTRDTVELYTARRTISWLPICTRFSFTSVVVRDKVVSFFRQLRELETTRDS